MHVLMLCTHDSARSVLAEAMPNHRAGRLGKETMHYAELQAALQEIGRS